MYRFFVKRIYQFLNYKKKYPKNELTVSTIQKKIMAIIESLKEKIMPEASKMFKYEYLKDQDILIGKFLVDSLNDKDEAKTVYDYAIAELGKQPKTNNFIMDVTSLDSVSSYSIGTLMKSLEHMKKTKGYMVLLIKESLLQTIMVQHPIMFDFFAVFHELKDGIAYIKK